MVRRETQCLAQSAMLALALGLAAHVAPAACRFETNLPEFQLPNLRPPPPPRTLDDADFPRTTYATRVDQPLTAGRCERLCSGVPCNCTEWTPWPTATTERCFRLDQKRNTCLFENVIYDTETRAFRYYGSAHEREGEGLQIKMHVGVMPSRQAAFRIIYMGDAPFPPPDATCEERQLTYLHGLYNSHSFGHVVRDNFQAILWSLMNLGLQAEPFKLLVVERHKRMTTVPRVVRKYSSWIVNDIEAWENRVARCRKGLILFRRFLTGYGGIIYTRPPKGCFAANFLLQRELAYQMMNLTLVPTYRLPRILVLFGDKSHADSRRITNIHDMLPLMRARFPDADFTVRVLSTLSDYDQLKVLRKTSIFISPVGSSSFRLIYLPSGAHVILVGAPEFDTAGNPLTPVFSEVDECWKNLPYLNFSSYRVTQANESITRFERLMHGWHPETPEQVEQYRIWDSDTVLNPNKLEVLLQDAIADLLSKRRAQGQL